MATPSAVRQAMKAVGTDPQTFVQLTSTIGTIHATRRRFSYPYTRRVAEPDSAEQIAAEALRDPDLLDAWRELAILRENPFLTPEWYLAWLDSHPEEKPFAIAWRVGGELRGVLPLVAVARAPFKLLRFAGARRGDWFTPACAVGDEKAMGRACASLLSAERRRWQAIRLDRIAAESDWPAALEGGGARIAPARRLREDVLPYIAFDDRGFEGYMADRSRNFRSQLGRRRRRLERDHGLRFRLTSSSAELGVDLDTFFRLHDERWRSRGEPSSQTASTRQLQLAFAAAALERGWLRLWTAEADDGPAGSWYGWRIGGRYCYALAGLVKGVETACLGKALLAHTIEQAAGEGAAIYDLMWGDEAYKRRFETGRRYASTWMLSRRGHPTGAAIAMWVCAAGGVEALPPRVRDGLKRVRRVAGRA
jgi:CelD/BcsL family acetyltransferase involved in cellulose biosynthesis